MELEPALGSTTVLQPGCPLIVRAKVPCSWLPAASLRVEIWTNLPDVGGWRKGAETAWHARRFHCLDAAQGRFGIAIVPITAGGRFEFTARLVNADSGDIVAWAGGYGGNAIVQVAAPLTLPLVPNSCRHLAAFSKWLLCFLHAHAPIIAGHPPRPQAHAVAVAGSKSRSTSSTRPSVHPVLASYVVASFVFLLQRVVRCSTRTASAFCTLLSGTAWCRSRSNLTRTLTWMFDGPLVTKPLVAALESIEDVAMFTSAAMVANQVPGFRSVSGHGAGAGGAAFVASPTMPLSARSPPLLRVVTSEPGAIGSTNKRANGRALLLLLDLACWCCEPESAIFFHEFGQAQQRSALAWALSGPLASPTMRPRSSDDAGHDSTMASPTELVTASPRALRAHRHAATTSPYATPPRAGAPWWGSREARTIASSHSAATLTRSMSTDKALHGRATSPVQEQRPLQPSSIPVELLLDAVSRCPPASITSAFIYDAVDRLIWAQSSMTHIYVAHILAAVHRRGLCGTRALSLDASGPGGVAARLAIMHNRMRDRWRSFPHEVVAATCDALDEYVNFCLSIVESARRDEVATVFEGPIDVVDAKAVPSEDGSSRRKRSHRRRPTSRFGTAEDESPRLGGLIKFTAQLARLMASPRRSVAVGVSGGIESASQVRERRQLCTWLIRALSRAIVKLSPSCCPEYRNLLQCVNTIGSSNWRHASLFVRLITRSWKPAESEKLQLLLQLVSSFTCRVAQHTKHPTAPDVDSGPPSLRSPPPPPPAATASGEAPSPPPARAVARLAVRGRSGSDTTRNLNRTVPSPAHPTAESPLPPQSAEESSSTKPLLRGRDELSARLRAAASVSFTPYALVASAVRLASECVTNQHTKVAVTALNLFDPSQARMFPVLRARPDLVPPVLSALTKARTSHWSRSVKKRAANVLALVSRYCRTNKLG